MNQNEFHTLEENVIESEPTHDGPKMFWNSDLKTFNKVMQDKHDHEKFQDATMSEYDMCNPIELDEDHVGPTFLEIAAIKTNIKVEQVAQTVPSFKDEETVVIKSKIKEF